MERKELQRFFDYLGKSRKIFGPKKTEIGQNFQAPVLIEKLENFDELFLTGQVPFYPYKSFFVPEREELFDYKNDKFTEKISHEPNEKIALFGVNLLDLKSFLLYDQVFERDSYYQARRQNILVIGHSILPEPAQNIFEEKFEEDILEHLSFDIFLAEIKQKPEDADEFAVFTGSLAGQKILDDFGYKEYIHIQFSGPVREGKLDLRMLELKDKLENKHNQKIWDELGARCIECGKCTIACPTCFCFRIDDEPELGDRQGQRQRCWDSCYYQEFSQVAGGHKFLDSTAKRIHFWYFHKFARIPEEFNFMGCVGCHRCAAVCPVNIDIVEVLKSIEES